MKTWFDKKPKKVKCGAFGNQNSKGSYMKPHEYFVIVDGKKQQASTGISFWKIPGWREK